MARIHTDRPKGSGIAIRQLGLPTLPALVLLQATTFTACGDGLPRGGTEPTVSPQANQQPVSPIPGYEGDGTPIAEFAFVSAGHEHTCGLKADGSVECWGDDEYGQATPPPREFASVSAGFSYTCGVRADGSVECWGSNEGGYGNVLGQATPPKGEFISVSAGVDYTCSVTRDGSVACWGEQARGLTALPGG